MNDERFVLIQIEPGPPVRFPLADSLTLGRVGCDVPVDDPEASRQHARITVRGDRVVVEDLRSRNGTFIAGRRIEAAAELERGAPLRIGDTVWEVEGVAGREPAPPPAQPAPPPLAAPPPAPPPGPAVVQAFSVAPARRPVSAARRVEATLVCYVAIVATAVGVVAYLAAR